MFQFYFHKIFLTEILKYWKSACNVLDDANGFDEITDRPFWVSWSRQNHYVQPRERKMCLKKMGNIND